MRKGPKVLLLGLAAGLALTWVGWLGPVYEEGRSKDEWSVLQTVMLLNGRTAEKRWTVVQHGSYQVLGIQSLGSPAVIWILLNPRYRPRVKKLSAKPRADYFLYASEFKEVLSAADVTDPDVLQELEYHLMPNP